MDQYPLIPNPLVGYLFSVGFLVYELVSPGSENDLFVRLFIAAFALLYYIYVVYTIHEVAEIRYKSRSLPSPTKAALLSLVPIYNLWWQYKWTSQLRTYIQDKDTVRPYDQRAFALILIGLLINRYDFSIGYAITTTGLLFVLRTIRELARNPIQTGAVPTIPPATT